MPDETFTVAEARQRLAVLLPTLDAVVRLRADLAELNAAVQAGEPSSLGGLAELKALNARLDEMVTSVVAAGAQVKGVAPLLLDFPARFGDVDVLLCWVEGERELGWWHRADLGFAGRRPLGDEAGAG